MGDERRRSEALRYTIRYDTVRGAGRRKVGLTTDCCRCPAFLSIHMHPSIHHLSSSSSLVMKSYPSAHICRFFSTLSSSFSFFLPNFFH